MNGLIYMYNPTTISSIIRHTIITIIDIRYLLFSLMARSGLIIYATFSITQSPYFFLNFCRRLSVLRLVCCLGYIDGVYLFHAFITTFYFFLIVELIFSICSHPHIYYFIIYSSYTFYKLALA